MDVLKEARKIFDIEIRALEKTRDALNERYCDILNIIINCKGKVIITGMGKPGHIAAKLAATFSSLGTSAFFVHPAEAMHGDLGMISKQDVVIAISYSGESDEIVQILPNIKIIGASIIGITANEKSTLAQMADVVQVLPDFEEACYLGLAPTSSTTAELCYGDSLAVIASNIYGFKEADFGRLHPAGALGKKLILKVDDLMSKGEDVPIVYTSALIVEAIPEMTKKARGIIHIVDREKKLLGIITDGDLRRVIEKNIDIYRTTVDTVMTTSPKKIGKDTFAVEALKVLKENGINVLPVVDSLSQLIGVITWQQIVNAGIVI